MAAWAAGKRRLRAVTLVDLDCRGREQRAAALRALVPMDAAVTLVDEVVARFLELSVDVRGEHRRWFAETQDGLEALVRLGPRVQPVPMPVEDPGERRILSKPTRVRQLFEAQA